ncbi:MAG TPA: hypothetical protein VHD14_14935 [Pseudolabrys sp.]|nr:hypothetical protein [Pseudolabrys sp.]
MGDSPRLHDLMRAIALSIAFVVPAAAQDVRGLEVCTAEKQMERRTSCLQSNVQFLQQALTRSAREAQEKFAAAGRELAAARAEIVSLKADLEKIRGELAELKKGKAGGKPGAKPAH